MLGGLFRLRSQLGISHRICSRSYSMSSANNSQYLADKTSPLCGLNVTKPFNLLTSQEKFYTHWVGKAAWAGARIIQGQWTPYACDLYDLLIATFSNGEKVPRLTDLGALQAKSGLDDEEWEAILQYTIQVIFYLIIVPD